MVEFEAAEELVELGASPWSSTSTIMSQGRAGVWGVRVFRLHTHRVAGTRGLRDLIMASRTLADEPPVRHLCARAGEKTASLRARFGLDGGRYRAGGLRPRWAMTIWRSDHVLGFWLGLRSR